MKRAKVNNKICHLHIGMHKTGSSSIQEYLEVNRGEVGEGVYYAKLGPANHSGPLLYALLFDPAVDSEISQFGLLESELKKNVCYFKDKLYDSLNEDFTEIIFSSEALVKLTIEELKAFKAQLLQFVGEVRVYCYVREPIPFMVSAFQQIIKTGPMEPNNQNICPNYESKLSKFELVFGKVNYRMFSKEDLVEGDVVKDFCNWLGLSLHQFNNVNISLGALAVKFLYRFQHSRININVHQPDLNMLERYLSRLPNYKLLLPAKDINKLTEANKKDFSWMASRFKKGGCKFQVTYTDGGAGTVYGGFSEDEKKLILSLTESQEFNNYILAETGMSIRKLINMQLSHFSDLKFYVRRTGPSSIGGWCSFEATKEKLLEVSINGRHIGDAIADKYRADLTETKERGYVGYSYFFDTELCEKDILTIMCDNKLLFSGYM